MSPPLAAPILIADYDPRWPEIYEAEKERILDAIGRWLADIRHVGSTAVPGLAAKPTIDVMPGLRSLDDALPCIAPLGALGYEYRPELESELPERRYFDKPAGSEWRGLRKFHLHMVETSSDFWRRHILFRDYLREHPEVAREYESLKRELAARYGADREGYTGAKTAFITSIEERARAESESNVGRGLQTPTWESA